MKTTQFKFFKNTPLIDFQNTIHFKDNAERDAFFLEGDHYPSLDTEHRNFNFIRDKSTLDLSIDYKEFQGVNYCTFYSEFDNFRFYAYVMSYEYIQPNNTRVYLMIDPIMTYTQGTTLEKLTNLKIDRQHLTKSNYKSHLWELQNNDDILKTNSKYYFHSERLIFSDLMVVMMSSADLQADFGTVDDPKIKASYGSVFDKITSPLNLYAIDIKDFNKLMAKISDFPWISQNIKSMNLIPRVFMEGNLTKLQFANNESLSGVNYLYRISGSTTFKSTLINELKRYSKDTNQLTTLFGFDSEQDLHLLRNEYTTIELYNYSGGQLFLDVGQLHENLGLALRSDIITGYHTEMIIYIEGYRVKGAIQGERQGAYKNDSLVFNQFDDIPMLIDNFNLSLAKNANQRRLAESKLISNRISNVMNPNADLKDRFFDAASLISNVSLSGLFGKFTDEHEFYRRQKAEQADMALETPTITEQTNGNSFNIANDMFGIHIKYSKPSTTEMKKIKKYYKLFGFQLNENSGKLDSVQNMSICNYLQFSGSWTIPDCDVALIEMMKAQFENGVRFWHNNNTPNPMDQDTLQNKMKW